MSDSAETRLETKANTSEVAERVRAVLDEHQAVQIATIGGPWTPWILGAYMARAEGELADELARRAGPAVFHGLDIVLMVEMRGKTMANLRADPRIAVSISHGDATRDFIQASGRAVLLPETATESVMAALVGKMPWYKLYTPCLPVGLAFNDLFVTSFSSGWMPARRLTNRWA